jgi:hypothetical protein
MQGQGQGRGVGVGGWLRTQNPRPKTQQATSSKPSKSDKLAHCAPRRSLRTQKPALLPLGAANRGSVDVLGPFYLFRALPNNGGITGCRMHWGSRGCVLGLSHLRPTSPLPSAAARTTIGLTRLQIASRRTRHEHRVLLGQAPGMLRRPYHHYSHRLATNSATTAAVSTATFGCPIAHVVIRNDKCLGPMVDLRILPHFNNVVVALR